MEKLLFLLYCFGIISVICPIINYVYLFLATRLNFHQEFVDFLLDENIECRYYFFTPVLSCMVVCTIILYVLYKLILKPLYIILIGIPFEGFKWLSNILLKPILKNQFKNKL